MDTTEITNDPAAPSPAPDLQQLAENLQRLESAASQQLEALTDRCSRLEALLLETVRLLPHTHAAGRGDADTTQAAISLAERAGARPRQPIDPEAEERATKVAQAMMCGIPADLAALVTDLEDDWRPRSPAERLIELWFQRVHEFVGDLEVPVGRVLVVVGAPAAAELAAARVAKRDGRMLRADEAAVTQKLVDAFTLVVTGAGEESTDGAATVNELLVQRARRLSMRTLIIVPHRLRRDALLRRYPALESLEGAAIVNADCFRD